VYTLRQKQKQKKNTPFCTYMNGKQNWAQLLVIFPWPTLFN